MIRRAGWWLALLLVALPFAAPAAARTIAVGPDHKLTRPSQAAAIVQDGDTVLIAPGTYYDCAFWHANHITIAAAAPGVVMTDTACAGKASFVISGTDVTVRGITFQRIRVPDQNGAGIRAEGGDLTVENCDFINNQAAILRAANPRAALRIRGSRFRANGACNAGRCADTLMIDSIAALEVTGSDFEPQRAGLDIAATAARVSLRDNHFAAAPRSGLIALAVRGPIELEANTLTQPDAAEPALKLTGGAASVTLRGNSFRTATGGGSFVLNWSGADPVLAGNQIAAADTALSTSGAWIEKLRLAAHAVYDPLRYYGGKVKGRLFEFARRGVGKLLHALPF